METAQALLNCLYEKAIEKITSKVWMSEPKPDAYINEKQDYAWLRQPLTLIMLKAVDAGATKITLQQTSSAKLFGQGTYLIDLLLANPCGAK